MKEVVTDWTENEFKAYVFLYAAKSDYTESPEEKKVIRSIVDAESYRTIHREIDQDNDYQSIQKILYNVEKYNYTQKDIDQLLKDVRNLFRADHEIDLLEENMFLALKKLLHT
jgi:signal transduction histidine kinase